MPTGSNEVGEEAAAAEAEAADADATALESLSPRDCERLSRLVRSGEELGLGGAGLADMLLPSDGRRAGALPLGPAPFGAGKCAETVEL